MSLKRVLALTALCIASLGAMVSAQGQYAKASIPNTPNKDKIMALKPPAGSSVAIVVFEDLECPDCARAAPLLQEVSKSEKVPLVRHDFPLPRHLYSFDAAVIARYFDTKSKALGDEWREYAFAHQNEITPDNLKARASDFAKAHGTAMPFLLDPGNKLADKVKADFALGQRIGIQHTPTIFVVSNTSKGDPFVEVVDRSQLATLIENMKKTAVATTAKATAPKARSSKAAKNK